jgi:DNA-binding transcriptional LysR family regulator
MRKEVVGEVFALPVQVRHIRYVIATADHGSFRRAATALGVEESAISRRVRDLEDRLGAALFTRSAGGVQLTQAGKHFVQRGRKALSQIGMARAEVNAIGRGEDGEVRIGIFSSLASGFLSDLLLSFGERHNAVRLRIPGKATTLSGAWRPRDPVDDDRGGARAWWRRWIYFLISVFEVRVKR